MLRASRAPFSSTVPMDKQPDSASVILCSQDLLDHSELPAWFQALHGPSIRRGYRPVLRSKTFYLASLLTMHNETMNIWSHFAGCATFAVLLAVGDRTDDVYMIAYRIASAVCFLISACYHTFMPISEHAYLRLQRLDYAGIFILIGVSAIPYYSIQYACSPSLELAAVATTSTMMLLLAFLVSTASWFAKDTPRGKLLRAVAFTTFAVTCTVFGGLAVFTGFSPRPYIQADGSLRTKLWAVTALYGGGVVVYAFGWPERLRPGQLTDLLGASHQIMHVCVFGAALVNGWCMERTRELQPLVAGCDDP